MKFIKSLLVTLLLLSPFTPIFAGAGHSHTVSKTKIERNAQKEILRLVKKNKLDSSWKSAQQIDIKKQGVLTVEWIVSFQNNKIQDPKKQVIYVYLTTYGKVKGANYKGD